MASVKGALGRGGDGAHGGRRSRHGDVCLGTRHPGGHGGWTGGRGRLMETGHARRAAHKGVESVVETVRNVGPDLWRVCRGGNGRRGDGVTRANGRFAGGIGPNLIGGGKTRYRHRGSMLFEILQISHNIAGNLTDGLRNIKGSARNALWRDRGDCGRSRQIRAGKGRWGRRSGRAF